MWNQAIHRGSLGDSPRRHSPGQELEHVSTRFVQRIGRLTRLIDRRIIQEGPSCV